MIARQSYKVKKMKHPKKGMLDKIVFNSDITIFNIPEKAYEYVVNERPAIEWIIDQYQVKQIEVLDLLMILMIIQTMKNTFSIYYFLLLMYQFKQ